MVIAARKLDQLTATAEEIRKLGGKCDTMQINIRDSAKALELVEAIVAKHGKLTCLVVRGQFSNFVGQVLSHLTRVHFSHSLFFFLLY